MKINLILFAIIISILSCKNDKNPVNKSDISYLESEYAKTKADSTFNQLIQALGKAVINSSDKQEKQSLLAKAIELSNAPEKMPLKEVFMAELLKVNPEQSKSGDLLYELAQNFESKNKLEVASMLYAGFKKRYPDDNRVKDIEMKIKPEQDDHEKYFKTFANNVLNNPGENGVNADNTELFIDLCESYALAFPKEKMAPVYLFKAADMARALKNIPKMLSMYDWIYQYYPTWEKAPLALFLKGYTLDTELAKFDEAKTVYELFLENHPQDSLAEDTKFLLDNLGKAPDQMFKEMEKK